MKCVYGSLALFVALLSCNATDAKNNSSTQTEPDSKTITANNDSLKIVQLGKELKTLQPLNIEDFKAKFPKEFDGFKLGEIDGYVDDHGVPNVTANYIKDNQTIVFTAKDAGGTGADDAIAELFHYLDIKKLEDIGEHTFIKEFKGYQVYFDGSMFQDYKSTNINYFESNRYAVVASANNVSLKDLEAAVSKFSL